jgi:uncharacterized protein (DUF952 family)
MAEVFLARKSGPHGFTKRVAVKRILPELSGDSQLIQMFCDEARIAATLTHPNIAQVLEFGEHEGELFIVMEYVDGVACSMLLRTAAQRGEAIPAGAALYIAREVLLALAFAHEAVDEALKLEAALARLRTPHLVALLHYSPIQQTVDGEPPEIYAFLGSSRLEEPIGRYPVSLVLHGHAHRGQLEGTTKGGVPVYNVSMPLLTRTFGDRPPFRVFEVPLAGASTADPAMAAAKGRRVTDAVAS